jgi:hypothetical protein
MKKFLFFFWTTFVLFNSACSSFDSNDNQAQAIIDKAIEAHGGKRYENLRLAYDFRDRHYTLERKGGNYTYTREFQDSTGQVKDVLNNEGFQRLINNKTANIPEERKNAYANSVNSVHYFALLPFGLNDPAVNKSYIGETEIKGTPYHLIKVTFSEEGGGADHEDEFLYWINANTYTMDYLAYSFQNKVEGQGYRFREAKSPREIGGVRFQDYVNYKPASKGASLESLRELYEQGQLEVLSTIELENIQVKAK